MQQAGLRRPALQGLGKCCKGCAVHAPDDKAFLQELACRPT